MGYSKKRRYKKKQYGGDVVFKYPEEDFKYAQIYGLIKDDDVRNNVIKIMNEDKHFLFTKDDLLPPQDPGTLELDLYKDFKQKIDISTNKKDIFGNFITDLKDPLKSAYENENNVFLRKFIKALHDASNKVLFDQITQEKLFLKKLFPNSGTYIDSIYNVSITSAFAAPSASVGVTDPTIILSANLVSEITFNISVIINAIELENLSILSHLKTIKIFDAIGENKYSFIKSDSVENVTIENNTFSDINQLFFERCSRLKNITIKSISLVGDVNSILEKLPDGGESKTVDLTNTGVTIGDQAEYESLQKQKKITSINIPTATAASSITPSTTSVDQTKILKRNKIISGIRIALIEAKYNKVLKTIIGEKKTLEKEKASLEAEKTTFEVENKKTIDKAQQELEASNAKIQALEAEKQTVYTQKTALETEKAILEAQAKTQADALQTANAKATAAAEEVKKITTYGRKYIADLEKKHADALKMNLAEKKQNQNKIKKVQSDLQKLQSELVKLRSEGAGQKEIKKTEGDIAVFTGLIQNLNAETARKDSEISKIREQQTRAEKQLQDELNTKIRKAEQREAEQQRQLENIRAEQQKAEQQRQIELKKIQLSQYELDQANKRLYDDLQRVASERNQLAGIMNNMHNEISAKNQQLAAIESENKRLVDQQRKVELEAEQKRQIELEVQKKINERVEQLRIEHEAEQKRQAEVEAEQKRLAELEAERIKQEEIEAERIKQEEIEAERIRQEEIEAERIRQAEIEAERIRQAEIEAEKQRQAEIEAEKQKQAEIEAEKQRQAEIEAEKQRQADVAAEAEQKRQAEIEAEKQRQAGIEAERIKQEEIETQQKRQAEIEAEKQRQAATAAEAEKQRQAAVAAEAEKQRQAEIEAEKQRQAEIEAEKQRQAEIEAEKQRQAEIEAENQRQAEIEAEKQRQSEAEAEQQRPAETVTQKSQTDINKPLYTAPLYECAVGTGLNSGTRKCDQSSGEKSSIGYLLNNNGIAKLIVESRKNQKTESKTYENIVFAEPDSNKTHPEQHLVVNYYDGIYLKKVFFKAPIPTGVKEGSQSNRDKWIEQINLLRKPLYKCNYSSSTSLSSSGTRMTGVCNKNTFGFVKNTNERAYITFFNNTTFKNESHTSDIISVSKSQNVGKTNTEIVVRKNNNTSEILETTEENQAWWIEQINKMIPAPKRGGTKHKRSDNKHNDTKQNRGKKFRVTRKKLRKEKRS